jgi:hypothetical protein
MLSERDKQLFSVVKHERTAKEARKAATKRAADPKHGGTWPFAKVQLQMMEVKEMIITIHLLAYDHLERFREVLIPTERMAKIALLPEDKKLSSILDAVFYYGQNDFQPQEMPSVSAGDVIFWNDQIFKVMGVGFHKMTGLEYAKYAKQNQEERMKHSLYALAEGEI